MARSEGTDPRRRALVAVVGIGVATVAAALFAGAYLLGSHDSPVRPFVLLAREPFAWVVIAALVVAAVGHAYID